MPSGLKQPVGQKRLTNIAVVRLRKAGRVFEIACYKNKVSNWRAEIETDLDEVLQTTAVFSNVSKGIMAKEKQLKDAFGTAEAEKICLEILSKGELQVSEKERKLEYEFLYRDVASIIAEKCIDPASQRQYTATMIERALKDVHFNPDLKKSAKQQAFTEALPLLQMRFSIQRANMRVRLHAPVSFKKAVAEIVQQEKLILESSVVDANSATFICLVEPGVYRVLHQLMEQKTHSTGRIELISLTAVVDATNAAPAQEQQPSKSSQPPEQVSKSAALPRKAVKHTAKEEKEVVYERGCIADLPEDFGRKKMFSEIDSLEDGWEVELVQDQNSDVVQAVFYAPSGVMVGAFAKARRLALASRRQCQMLKQTES